MNSPESSYFEQRYQQMDDEEIAVLFARSLSKPDSLTEEARTALSQVISRRKIDVSATLKRRKIAEHQDRIVASGKLANSQARSKKVTTGVGKVLGWVGMLGGGVVLIPSLQQNHIGGILAGLATAVCSAWLAFRYNGD